MSIRRAMSVYLAVVAIVGGSPVQQVDDLHAGFRQRQRHRGPYLERAHPHQGIAQPYL